MQTVRRERRKEKTKTAERKKQANLISAGITDRITLKMQKLQRKLQETRKKKERKNNRRKKEQANLISAGITEADYTENAKLQRKLQVDHSHGGCEWQRQMKTWSSAGGFRRASCSTPGFPESGAEISLLGREQREYAEEHCHGHEF